MKMKTLIHMRMSLNTMTVLAILQALSPGPKFTRRVASFLGSHHSPAVGHSLLHSCVLLRSGHNSMNFKCFVSQPFSMENRGDRAMVATGSFEERDTFREA